MALLDRWYAEAGKALHDDGRKPHRPEVAEEILDGDGPRSRAGRPRPSTIPPPATRSRPSTTVVATRGGFGVPTLVFEDDQMLFGPVLVDPPTGAAAVRLWDLTVGWLEFPHLYEVQRPKSAADIDAIATAFSAVPRGPGLVLDPEPHAVTDRGSPVVTPRC